MAEEFLIWSIEHTAWWRPHWQGYTVVLREAGRYSRAEADTILERANSVSTQECRIPVSAVDGSVTPNEFHAHLDACAQCREHPFDLCATGARLLRSAVDASDRP